jgi:hypothetical protein
MPMNRNYFFSDVFISIATNRDKTPNSLKIKIEFSLPLFAIDIARSIVILLLFLTTTLAE